MHQIISGETHKTKVVDKEKVNKFLKNQKSLFDNFKSNCLYETGDLINSPVLNYLNYKSLDKTDQLMKSILINEYDELEKIYPYLGDLLLYNFFDKSRKNKTKSFKVNKKIISDFFNEIENKSNKELFSLLVNKCSLEYMVDISFYKGKEIIFEKVKENNFKLYFDYDFYKDTRNNQMFEYKVVVIDGVIQNVSEIHHLLYDSAENKSKYVIFCYGMSEEVKHTIITNNKKNITNVFPISLNFDENSLNVLNDIAILHDCDIISANKGQTISTEIRKIKAVGKKIKINKDSFSFIPVCSENKIEAHKIYLNKKINNTNIDDLKSIFSERYKRLFGKKIILKIPDLLKKDTQVIRELDYILRFFSNQNKFFVRKKINKKDNKKVYFPLQYLKIVENKNMSLNKTFENLEKIVIKSNETR